MEFLEAEKQHRSSTEAALLSCLGSIPASPPAASQEPHALTAQTDEAME